MSQKGVVIKMKISVAIATYNGASFITQQLESIMNQTRQVDEVVICDDVSKDDTVKVVEEFIRENNLSDKWSVSVNSRNKGYASNFIGAARKTKGDLILFCDQDDIWLPQRVFEIEKIMTENPQIMLLGSEFKPFTSSDDAPEVPGWEMKQMKNDGSLEKKDFCPQNVFIGCQGCTMCVRQTFFRRVEPYWYEGWAHDEFVWKMALCLDGLYMYHAYTLKRRLHSNNVTMHKMRDVAKRTRFLEDLLKSHEVTLKFAQDINLDDKKIKLLKRNIKATKKRIELFKNRKILNTVPLALFYRDCYHKSRAILVELYMVLKG